MERSEAVVYGLGGFVQRRLAAVQERKNQIWDLKDEKDAVRKKMARAGIMQRALIRLSYGDWLTDYETDQIRALRGKEAELLEMMTEVVSLGRVDRVEKEIRETIARCFAYLNSYFRATDMVGRRLAQETIGLASEAIEALAILDAPAAEELSEKLDQMVQAQALWYGPAIV